MNPILTFFAGWGVRDSIGWTVAMIVALCGLWYFISQIRRP